MFFVYVLFSLKDGRLYIGYSSNLERRLSEHNNGDSPSTMYRRPLKLIYYEAYLSEGEAKRREKYLKGGSGRTQLKAQLAITFRTLHYRFREDRPKNIQK